MAEQSTANEPVVVFDPAKDATFQPPERSLQENEAVIRAGLGTFVEVGRALADIRNSGQHREAGYDTFDDYCRERWGLGGKWAQRQIASAKVVEALNGYEHIQRPENAEQALPLYPLLNGAGKDAVRAKWQEIVEAHEGDGAITGREVRAHLNPSASLAPSQRSVSDAYLATLDKLNSTLKSLQWSAGKGQGSEVPRPVAERYADYVADTEALTEAVRAIANGKPPDPELTARNTDLTTSPTAIGDYEIKSEWHRTQAKAAARKFHQLVFGLDGYRMALAGGHLPLEKALAVLTDDEVQRSREVLAGAVAELQRLERRLADHGRAE